MKIFIIFNINLVSNKESGSQLVIREPHKQYARAIQVVRYVVLEFSVISKTRNLNIFLCWRMLDDIFLW